MPKKNDFKIHKDKENVVLWWNGAKWLVKETCSSKQKAKDLETELNARKNA